MNRLEPMTDIELRARDALIRPLPSMWQMFKASLMTRFAVRVSQAQREAQQSAVLQTLLRQERLLEQIALQGVEVRQVPMLQAPVPSVPNNGTMEQAVSKHDLAREWLIKNPAVVTARVAKPLMEADGLTIGIGTIQRAINELREEGTG